MRNLLEYPVTYQEKIDFLNSLINFRKRLEEEKGKSDIGYGEMTLTILQEIAKDIICYESEVQRFLGDELNV